MIADRPRLDGQIEALIVAQMNGSNAPGGIAEDSARRFPSRIRWAAQALGRIGDRSARYAANDAQG